MRLAVLGLLLANLVLFAWSQWLSPAAAPAPAVPITAAAGDAPSRILLASEAPTRPPVAATAAPSEGAALAEPADGTPSAAAGLAPVAIDANAAVEARRCVSMGPFSELELTAQATAMLKQDGYEPRQRPANGPVPDGFMVMIGPLKGEADQARVVGRLNRGGLDDAFALPKLEDGYAVSVGLFSQRARAERRALAVERMGLKASIVERTRPGTVYWIDFDLKTAPAGSAGALDPMLKTPDPSQKWQVVPCPQPRPVG